MDQAGRTGEGHAVTRRPLSPLQERVLQVVAKLQHASMADLLERVCGWTPRYRGRLPSGGLCPSGNHYSRAVTGAREYRARNVALLRACTRLEARGLLAPATYGSCGFTYRARCFALTDAGRERLESSSPCKPSSREPAPAIEGEGRL